MSINHCRSKINSSYTFLFNSHLGPQKKRHFENSRTMRIYEGGLGGGGGAFCLLGIRNSTPCRPKGSLPLYYFEIFIFGDGPKDFSKGAFGANIYQFWGGSTLRKNAIFWSKLSKTCLKTPFLACFFKIFVWAEKLVKMGSLNGLRRAPKTPTKFSKFFENPPLSRKT